MLTCCVDANFAGDPTTLSSSYGYNCKIGNNTVSYRSKKLPKIALSTLNSELLGAAESCREVVYLRTFLDELGHEQQGPTRVDEDNNSTVRVSENPCHSDATKHIILKAAYVRELVQDKEVVMHLIPGNDNPADIFTKPLGPKKFERFAKMLCGEDNSNSPSQ